MKHILIPLCAAACLALSGPARAAPHTYELEPETSSVSFTYTLLGNDGIGTMPILSADLVLDFQDVAHSTAKVSLDAANTKTGVGFVTNALKSPEVLSTEKYPTISFTSAKVVQQKDGARITGNVTVRGVTRPLTLDARIFRQRGSETGDLSHLTVMLTGSINRSDFGASGYADTVADTVKLRILARLREAP